MTTCTIDGLPRIMEQSDADDFAGFMDNLSAEMARGRRFISTLKINGREILPGSEWFVQRTLSVDSVVEVTSGSSFDLVYGAISYGETLISDLRVLLGETVEAYRCGNDPKGIKSFVTLVSCLEEFVNLTGDIGETLQLDFSTLRSGGVPLAGEIESLNQILMEIIQSQENRDWVLLGDLLEYELLPLIDYWQEVFVMFSRMAQESFA